LLAVGNAKCNNSDSSHSGQKLSGFRFQHAFFLDVAFSDSAANFGAQAYCPGF